MLEDDRDTRDDTSRAGAAVVLCAPFDGVVRALDELPDHVFAAGIAGPGVAVEPLPGAAGQVLAHSPVAGRLVTVFAQAFAVEPQPGLPVLVHLGLDTVRLAGAGFAIYAGEGEQLALGDPVIGWHPDEVAAAGFSTLTPVVALQADAGAVSLLVASGDAVRAGQPVLSWVVADD
ncbi:PTS sugar transporter subunit IIA [Luteimicrobium subarcticum]|uniref:PTS system glucose-specific IIA component/PTS system N-acetylglucosamine-specific IIA component n=1 Tax=Luteimicrobium subarcticum TaxID=620910 RepID=A0A2M8WU70_9MICO|nr:PTS glucose transporter subunit IIA [Luteimicrobium subarcticum]PJI94497.1 PTS system glucose-specific IIA component/PTS system N-acetylglucosamine-specific IIA component [Luteimicrobium subarcticum]